MVLGYTGKEFDEPDYHPPSYLLGGSSVVWDDISLQPTTEEGPTYPEIPIFPSAAIPAAISTIGIVTWKRKAT